MNLKEFKQSLSEDTVPSGISTELKALWFEAKGDWDKAHNIVQSMTTKNAAWVHAYLHRKEPDEWNASYWYSIAGKPIPKISFESEWDEIAKNLLAK